MKRFPSGAHSLQNTAAFTAAFCLLFFQQPFLSLACFSIFSSSSSSESYVDTTQCWSQLLEQGIVAAYRYKEGLFSCLPCGYQNSFHFYFFKVCHSVSRGSAGASSLSALSWWAPVGVDEHQEGFFQNSLSHCCRNAKSFQEHPSLEYPVLMAGCKW